MLQIGKNGLNFLQQCKNNAIEWFRSKWSTPPDPAAGMILRHGHAKRVIFFDASGDEPTYVEGVFVTLYSSGIVHVQARHEESTVHLQNCEILWNYREESESERKAKIHVLRARSETVLSHSETRSD